MLLLTTGLEIKLFSLNIIFNVLDAQLTTRAYQINDSRGKHHTNYINKYTLCYFFFNIRLEKQTSNSVRVAIW